MLLIVERLLFDSRQCEVVLLVMSPLTHRKCARSLTYPIFLQMYTTVPTYLSIDPFVTKNEMWLSLSVSVGHTAAQYLFGMSYR